MKKFKLYLVALLLAGVAGCGFLFGGPEQLIDAGGTPVVNPDGTPAMVYKEGAVQKLTRAIAPIATKVPYGNAGLAVLTIISGIGAGIQTMKAKKKVSPEDVVDMIDDIGDEAKNIRNDEDVGDLVSRWKPDSLVSKLLRGAFLKKRNGS